MRPVIVVVVVENLLYALALKSAVKRTSVYLFIS